MSRIYLHPLSLRIWHWINALIVLLLIGTGIELRILSLHIFHDYRFLVLVHKYLGFAMTGSFLFWFFYQILTGELKNHYLININDVKGIPRQIYYYAFLYFKGKKNPFKPLPDNKFNPLQKLAYFLIMFIFVPLVTITGIMLSQIPLFFPIISVIGGRTILNILHVSTAYIFVIYLFIHVYMSTLGTTFFSKIKSMITGYE